MIYRARFTQIVNENGDVTSVPVDDGEVDRIGKMFEENTKKQIKILRELEKKNEK